MTNKNYISEKCEKLINHLSDEKGNPVHINDVIFTPCISVCVDNDERIHKIYDLWCLWFEFGDMPLNEIFSGEIVGNVVMSCCQTGHCRSCEQFKDPNIQKIYKFLWEVFGDEIEMLIKLRS